VGAILKIEIVTDASKATAGFGKVADSAGKTGEKTASGLSKMGKAAATAAGAAALGGLVMMFKTGADEQMDFLAGNAQLEAGIKSTGNAANVSVDGLNNMASEIQNYSGQTDDSIAASQKLLLTFTNLTNGVGEGADMFDQATKMSADMAAKMGGDASKYAVQLGKALNDPVKGITALTKVGVSFTDAQKKQISALQGSGDMMGAQKIIMQELQKEFGGSAKAAGDALPGQLQKAQRSFEDVSQGLVAGLMPVLTSLADFINTTLMPAFTAFFGFVTENQTVFGVLAAGILAVVIVVKAWAIAQAILNSTLLTNPVFLIIAGIIALGAAFVIAYQKSETFRAIVDAVFSAIKTVIAGVIQFITVNIPAAFSALVGFVTGLPGRVASAGARIWSWLLEKFTAVWTAVTSGLGRAISWVGTIPAKFAAGGAAAWNWLLAKFSSAWSAVTGAIGRAIAWVGGLPGKLASAASGAWDWLGKAFSDAWQAVQQAFSDGLSWLAGIPGKIADALSGIFDIITKPFKDAWNWINDKVFGPIKSVWNGVANAINGVSFSVTIPAFVPIIGGKSWSLDLPNIPTLDSGGYVTGATLAMIGERRPEIVAAEPVLRRIVREELGGTGTITINVHGALFPDDAARAVASVMRRQQRRQGGAFL
jgi:hypothetical protein